VFCENGVHLWRFSWELIRKTRGFGWIWGTCCTCIKKLLWGICVKLVAKFAKYGDVPIKTTDVWNVKARENPSNAPTSPGTIHYVALLCTNHATWPTLSRCICTCLAVEGSLVMFCSRSGGRSQGVLENMVPLSRGCAAIVQQRGPFNRFQPLEPPKYPKSLFLNQLHLVIYYFPQAINN